MFFIYSGTVTLGSRRWRAASTAACPSSTRRTGAGSTSPITGQYYRSSPMESCQYCSLPLQHEENWGWQHLASIIRSPYMLSLFHFSSSKFFFSWAYWRPETDWIPRLRPSFSPHWIFMRKLTTILFTFLGSSCLFVFCIRRFLKSGFR